MSRVTSVPRIRKTSSSQSIIAAVRGPLVVHYYPERQDIVINGNGCGVGALDCLTFAPTENRLASVEGAHLIIRNFRTDPIGFGLGKNEFELQEDLHGQAACIAWLQNGMLVIGTKDGRALFLDAGDAYVINSMEGFGSKIVKIVEAEGGVFVQTENATTWIMIE